jgi:hypothetical protein
MPTLPPDRHLPARHDAISPFQKSRSDGKRLFVMAITPAGARSG